jgi:hypothetical protein
VLEGAAGDAVGAKGDALPLREAGGVPVGARGEGEADGEPLVDALREGVRGRPGRTAIAMNAAESVDKLTHAQFTHSSVPSAKTWCFQTGSNSLVRSTRAVHAAKATSR